MLPHLTQSANTKDPSDRTRSHSLGVAFLASLWLLAMLAGCYKPLVLKCSDEAQCEAGKECQAGQCVCKANHVACGTECVRLDTDPDNCGACGTTCPPTKTCTTGKCGNTTIPTTCKPTETLCGKLCVTLTSDVLHCGACNKACAKSDACNEGSCGCPDTHARCNGACVNLQNTAAHCGSCGKTCPTGQSCCQGACSNTAGPTPEICDGADNNCDGRVDENVTKPCYSGPADTAGVGECKEGTQTCKAGFWGPCTGESKPQLPGCDGKDLDCDGAIDPPCNVDPWHQTTGTSQDDYGIDVIADQQGNVYVRGFTNAVLQASKTTFSPKDNNNLFVLKYDPTGTPLWIVPAGRYHNESPTGTMSIMSNGDLLISGVFNGTLTWSGGSLQAIGGSGAFLARIQPNGELRWAKKVDGRDDEWGIAHTVDADENIYLTGGFRNDVQIAGVTLKTKDSWDIFLAKFDKDGKALWAKGLHGNNLDHVRGIEMDPTNKQAIYLMGMFYNDLSCGKWSISSFGDKDVFLARFDRDGECTWIKALGGSSTEEPKGLTVHTQGITVAGTFHRTASFGGQQLTAKDKYPDTFVARFDDKGDVTWAKAISSPVITNLKSIVTSSSGKTYLFGTYYDTLTVGTQTIKTPISPAAYIVALDTAGKPSWLQQINRAANIGGDVQPTAVAVDSQDNITLAGTFVGTHSFGGASHKSRARHDIFLSHLSPKGTTLWVLSVGLDSTERCSALHIDARNLIYMTGGYYNAPTLDGKKLPERGRMDMITIKRAPR